LIRGQLLALCVLSIAVGRPASAQQPPSKYPPACESSQVSKTDVDRAHAVFLSGKQFLEESNYDKALSYFEDAYSIDCSVHAILPIIATAYERKGDKGEAIRALDEYLKRAPTAPDREVIERRIKNLTDLLAHEQPPAPNPPVTTPTPPAASAAVEASPPNPLASASPVATSPTPTNPEPRAPENHHSAWPWVVVGVGGAAVLVAAPIMYGVGSSKISSALSECPSRSCGAGSSGAISEGNDGRALERWAFVVGGAGLALGAAGLIWHFLEKTDAHQTSAWVSPVVASGYAGLGVAGSF
jgi:hypothetical protein